MRETFDSFYSFLSLTVAMENVAESRKKKLRKMENERAKSFIEQRVTVSERESKQRNVNFRCARENEREIVASGARVLFSFIFLSIEQEKFMYFDAEKNDRRKREATNKFISFVLSSFCAVYSLRSLVLFPFLCRSFAFLPVSVQNKCSNRAVGCFFRNDFSIFSFLFRCIFV